MLQQFEEGLTLQPQHVLLGFGFLVRGFAVEQHDLRYEVAEVFDEGTAPAEAAAGEAKAE